MATTDVRLDDKRMALAFDAYERGRRRWVLRHWVVFAVVSAAVAFVQPVATAGSWVAFAVLLVVVGVVRWRGGGAARAVWPGFVAGLVPLFGCQLMGCAASCSTSWWGTLSTHMPVLGLVGGALLSSTAWVWGEHRASFAVSAAAIASLVVSLGCTAFGVSGLVGIGVGAVVGAAPLWWRSFAPHFSAS